MPSCAGANLLKGGSLGLILGEEISHNSLSRCSEWSNVWQGHGYSTLMAWHCAAAGNVARATLPRMALRHCIAVERPVGVLHWDAFGSGTLGAG
jgi:hypothetical protein